MKDGRIIGPGGLELCTRQSDLVGWVCVWWGVMLEIAIMEEFAVISNYKACSGTIAVSG